MCIDQNAANLKKVFYYYGLDFDQVMICPFHDDNHPSFSVNFEEGMFHCFACGVTGDALDFVKLANPKLNGLYQLILYNAILNSDKVKKLSISKFRSSKPSNKKQSDREQDLKESYDYYSGLKTVDWKKTDSIYKKYMEDRGFTAAALNLCKAKLTIVNDRYPLIFPIYDNGRFKGYVSRTTNKHVEKRAKYMYNKGFSRNSTLGGDYKGKVVVACEGYMDALKLRQYGLKNVVAIFGWKITKDQVAMLKTAGVEWVISALDTDGPGIKGTKVLREHFKVVRFRFPKGVKDPGDLTKKQFKIAYAKTKAEYRRRKNVIN